MGYTVDSNPADYFDYVYTHKRWVRYDGCPLSGPGSDPRYCRPFVDYFWKVKQQLDINSVVMYGCGDCAMWGDDTLDERFIGIDINSGILEVAKQKQPRVSFTTNLLIPPCDLVLIKDVMIHWHDIAIAEWVEEAKIAARYIMIVERDSNTTQNSRYKSVERDPLVDTIGFCPLDLTKVNLSGNVVHLPGFSSTILLVKNDNTDSQISIPVADSGSSY